MLMKLKRNNRFDEQFLRSLVKQKDSGVTVKKTCQHLLLRPIHLNNVENSLKDVLRERIAKYNKDLKGILLGFKDIKLLNNLGVISNDSCGVHIDVSANFFVFEPEVNAEMQGIVIRKSKDHIGVLVYKSFNVSIPKQSEDDEWLGSSVNLGDEVRLSITYTDFNYHLPYIRGTLLSIVARNPNMDTKTKAVQTKSVNKKIKFGDDETIGTSISHIDDVIEGILKGSNSDKDIDVEESEALKKKSKRKKGKVDESGNAMFIDSLSTNISHIDDVIETVVKGSNSDKDIDVEESEALKKKSKKIKGKLYESGNAMFIDSLSTNISHIDDVIESVVKGSNSDNDMDMEYSEASKKELKRKKRKLDQSSNSVMIDSLLAQVKDEVFEQPKNKKRKLDLVDNAEAATYNNGEMLEKLKEKKKKRKELGES